MSDDNDMAELQAFAEANGVPKPPALDLPPPEGPPVIKKIGRHFKDCPCAQCIKTFGPVASRPPLASRSQAGRKRSPAAAGSLQQELNKRLPEEKELLSDANVGQAIAGAFAAIGMFRGGHWRLFAQEEAELGKAFGPLARLYGPEELGKWITALMLVPVVTGVIMPRIAVEREIMAGRTPKEGGRMQLLEIKSFVEAEKTIDVAQHVKESQAFAQAQAMLKARITAATEVTKELKEEQFAAEGVTQ